MALHSFDLDPAGYPVHHRDDCSCTPRAHLGERATASVTDPREVGGRYWSGYWSAAYVVRAIDSHDGISGPWFEVVWDKGGRSLHCTAWDPRRDRVLSDEAALACGCYPSRDTCGTCRPA